MDLLLDIPAGLASLEQVLTICSKDRQKPLSIDLIREMLIVITKQLIVHKNQRASDTHKQSVSSNSQQKEPEQTAIFSDESNKKENSKHRFEQECKDQSLKQAIISKWSQMQEIEIRVAKLEDIIENTRLAKAHKEEQASKYPKNFVNTETSYFPLFEVKGRHIKYVGDDIPTMILGKHNMSQISSFKIRIAECVLSNIKVGICDDRYANLRDCDKQSNMISMLGWNGQISTRLDYQSWKGVVFKSPGQAIEVRVDTGKGMITWIVDGTQSRSIEWAPLCDKTIKWVPMVRLLDKGTAIEWLEG